MLSTCGFANREICCLAIFEYFSTIFRVREAALVADLILASKPSEEAALAVDLITASRTGGGNVVNGPHRRPNPHFVDLGGRYKVLLH